MQQPALILARLDGVLLAREPVDDVDANAGVPDTIAQLGREVPLDLLSRRARNAIEQGAIRTSVPPSPNSVRRGRPNSSARLYA